MKAPIRDERYKKLVGGNEKLRLFTVCTGENAQIDNANTEKTLRVLLNNNVKHTMARFNNRRVVILVDTPENAALAARFTTQYGTQGFTVK